MNCPVCGAENHACGHQPLRFAPLDLGLSTPPTEAELEAHRRLRERREARRAARQARSRH